jgi:hypothetical protein
LELAFAAHVVEVLAEEVRDDDALFGLDEVALNLRHALHVRDLFKHLKLV